MSPKGKRRGRPADYVKSPSGEPIVGLSVEKTSGKYYTSHHRPKKFFGRDYHDAIRRFRAWEARQKGERIHVTVVAPIKDSKVRAEFQRYADKEEAWVTDDIAAYYRELLTVDQRQRATMLSDDFWTLVRVAILDDPYLAAQRTGLPLDRLESLPPSKPSITLSEALAHYKGKTKPISKDELKQIEWAWDDFKKTVSARTIRDIDKASVTKWIKGLVTDHSAKFAKNRIGRAKTVLLYNQKHETDQYCGRVLNWIRACDLPSASLMNPNPISVEDFKRLIEVGRTEADYWEPMLKVALNCCYYAIDVIRLPVSAVNLDAGTITFVRAKENTPRIAVLWKSTIDALRPILEGRNHRQYVFESYRKGRWSKSGFTHAFKALKDKAGLKQIDFNQIRDGAYTAAVNAHGVTEKEAKLLAGHKLAGESDKYALRNPNGVAAACAAIERHYSRAIYTTDNTECAEQKTKPTESTRKRSRHRAKSPA